MPEPHVLGLTGSNIAPEIIMNAGNSIVQSLRRSGQIAMEQAEKAQTNRELKGFGQEASTLNPNSPEFPTALLGLAGKYPMAMQSQAGQNMAGILLAANKGFQNEESAIRDFNRQKALDYGRHNNRMDEARLEKELRDPRIFNTGNGLFMDGPNGIPEQVPGSARPQKELPPPRPVVIPGVGGFDPETRQPIPGMQVPPKVQPGAAPMSEYQRNMLMLRSLDNEIDNLVRDKNGTDDASAKADIQRRLDAKRLERDRAETSTAPLPVAAPVIVDPMNSGPAVPDVLPAKGAIVAPQFLPGKIYRDKSGARRVYDGQNFNPLP